MLTQALLKEFLHYDPLTGVFTRLASRKISTIGNEVGSKNAGGYLQVRLGSKTYLMHRLAFLYMTGDFPEHMADHINGIRDDNRWENLRPATRSQNLQNTGAYSRNSTGFKGVSFGASEGTYAAQIGFEGKKISLGIFTTAEAAALAYKIKSEELHSHRRPSDTESSVQVENLDAYRTANNHNKRPRKPRATSLSGLLGVRQVKAGKKTKKFGSQIIFNGHKYWLGTFSTAEEASAAYQAKFAELYSTSCQNGTIAA
jgi:hypothetical protein